MKRLIILFAACCLTICGCHRNKEVAPPTTFTFADDYGRTVDVPIQPKRVVSVSPAVTEIIFALGGQDLLVGRTDFCNYPEEAANIESIGGITNLNIEKIVSLKPDLVISGSMVSKGNTDHLSQMGIPIACVIEKQKFDGLYENISRIGQLIGRQAQADSLIGLLKLEIHKVTETKADIYDMGDDMPRPSVYYVVGFGKGGNYTAGNNTFINDIIELAGGRNVAEHISGWNFSLESLVASNPNYIVIRKEDSAAFCQMPPYNKLTAVRLNRVIAVDSGMMDIQAPRNVEAVKLLSSILNQ